MEVIFYAPLGRGIEKYKVGGAEMGCRRTLGIYEDAGFKVYCVEKAVNLDPDGAMPCRLPAPTRRWLPRCWLTRARWCI